MSRAERILKKLGESDEIVYIPEGGDIGTNVRSQTFPDNLLEEIAKLSDTDTYDWENKTVYVGFIGAAVADGADYDVHLQSRGVQPSDVFDGMEAAIKKVRSLVLMQNQMPTSANEPLTSYFGTIVTVKNGVAMPGKSMVRVLTNGQVTQNLELFGTPRMVNS